MTQIIHPYKLDVPNRDNFPRFTPKYTDSNSVCLVKFSCETLFIKYTCPNHYELLKIRSNLNGRFSIVIILMFFAWILVLFYTGNVLDSCIQKKMKKNVA